MLKTVKKPCQKWLLPIEFLTFIGYLILEKMKLYSLGFLLLVLVASSCNDALKETPALSTIEQLTLGNQRFLNNQSIHPHQNKAAVLANEKAQHPFAVVITCSDSRVSPEIVFDQGIGDLFVIRNAGNLITDIDMGSVEYAVEHLKTKLIIVLGHSECGAIKAFVENVDTKKLEPKHDHIEDIINTLKKEDEEKQVPRPYKTHLNECIVANIKHSTNQILKNTWIDQKEIQVIPMLYDIHTGRVTRVN